MMLLPLLVALSVATSATAARLPLINPTLSQLSKDFPPFAGARGAVPQPHKNDDDEDWTQMPGRMAMKFIVPPSRAEEFKAAWLNLKAAVEKNEDEHKVFGLEKSGLDNWVWWSYGEWESLDAMYNGHFETEWYADFSSDVDNMGAVWEAFWLGEAGFYSQEDEKEHDESNSENKFSVVATWLVPPKEKKDFVETWNRAAETIVKEDDGAKMLSLYKDWMTGSKFYAYAAWESFDAFREHLKSHHHSELMQWAADNDAYFMIEPLMPISDHHKE